MRIATWNVNSLKVRLGHVEEWMSVAEPDVVALQEIKQVTADFPEAAFTEAGYRSIASGQKTYNGVAVVSKSDIQGAVTELPDFEDEQRRVLAVTTGGVRVINLYVPNGSRVGSEKYEYKLRWLRSLADFLEQELEQHAHVVVLGDFNIAPADIDVYDAEKWGEGILCSPAERSALERIMSLGFVDVFREKQPAEQQFSWWDYRAGGFRRNLGLRIDLILANQAMAALCSSAVIDREPRAWERPSDHAPVAAVFDL